MAVVIPNETLRAAGYSEAEAKVEIAVRWFDAGKLSIRHAADQAGLSVDDLEAQLKSRGIPRYRYTEENLDRDVKTLKKLRRW